MVNDVATRFTLSDNTIVIVKKVLNNKFDFELILPNGNRKTFFWFKDAVNELSDKKGNIDPVITEAVQKFVRNKTGGFSYL